MKQDSCDRIRNKIRILKAVLDTKGVSDTGREYKVYSFSSCHIGDQSLENALKDLFSEL